ncbi:Uncharacterised protein [BD1-7 clade bacterium]|uniref:UPF0102 protein OPDIPICF_00575 n=1 Tax=BD1-7 clade bacterium TaxID=2029982 RepID=A0A5S9N1R1_9GAMM|nr:Uncharacterised protein [BD1-7 clade bacterium]
MLTDGIVIRLGTNTKTIGDYYEDVALDFLKEQGCQLVTRNFHSRRGEIDLIVKDDKTLVFVEVRFRRNPNYGSPLDTVTKDKQVKLTACAQYFLQTQAKYQHYECRFDAISITGDPDHLDIDWIKQAFVANS